MSWRDCHIGYLPLSYLLLLVGWLTDTGFLFGIGFFAQLNGLYAILYEDSDERINRSVWKLAFATSIILYVFFSSFQITTIWNGETPPLKMTLAMMALTTLGWNQIRFLIRVRRDEQIDTYAE